MGLQAKTSASLTTRIHQEGSQAAQPQTTGKEKPTIPKRPYQVWDQKEICHATIIGTTSWQEGKEIYSTSMGEFFVSRNSGRPHPSVTNTIYESKRGNTERNTTTVRLHRDARRSHNNTQPKRHETCSPQWCELLEQSKRTKSGRQLSRHLVL